MDNLPNEFKTDSNMKEYRWLIRLREGSSRVVGKLYCIVAAETVSVKLCFFL